MAANTFSGNYVLTIVGLKCTCINQRSANRNDLVQSEWFTRSDDFETNNYFRYKVSGVLNLIF